MALHPDVEREAAKVRAGWDDWNWFRHSLSVRDYGEALRLLPRLSGEKAAEAARRLEYRVLSRVPEAKEPFPTRLPLALLGEQAGWEDVVRLWEDERNWWEA